jgi:hypothetical protein
MASYTTPTVHSRRSGTKRSTERLAELQLKLGKLLCWWGIHRNEWRTIHDEDWYYDQHRCMRKECPHSKVWVTVNRDRYPW